MALQGGDTLTRLELVERIFGESSGVAESTIEHTTQSPLQQPIQFEVGEGASYIFELFNPQNYDSLCSNPLFQVVLMALLLLYIYWMTGFISHRQRGDYSEERWIYGDEELRSYDRFALSLGDALFSIAMMICMIDLFVPLGIDCILSNSEWIVSHFGLENLSLVEQIQDLGFRKVSTALSIYVLFAAIWQLLIFVSLSLFTYRENRWFKLIVRLKARLILPIMLFVVPLMILSAINYKNELLYYVVVTEVVTIVLVYIFRSLRLFVTQKISILHWFLYLCTVELIPILLFWVIFAKSIN